MSTVLIITSIINTKGLGAPGGPLEQLDLAQLRLPLLLVPRRPLVEQLVLGRARRLVLRSDSLPDVDAAMAPSRPVVALVLGNRVESVGGHGAVGRGAQLCLDGLLALLLLLFVFGFVEFVVGPVGTQMGHR